jgi:tetratricopeptide (TPR) repeat protein
VNTASRALGFVFPAICLLLGAASGQDVPVPQVEQRKGPVILVRPDPGQPSQPLRVSGVSAEVVIVSGIASTRLDLTFENPFERVLEGELVLPLPRGATVSSFALEIEGKLREASVVEREKARAVFEAVERQNVDPGLLEWVKGNNYRTRIYPIPAKGTKRVVIGYDQPLADAGSGTAPFVLPLAYGTRIRSFSCKVSVFGEAAPVVAKDGLPLKFAREGVAWKGAIQGSEVAEMEPRDLVLGLAIPTSGSEVIVERGRVRAALSKDPELVFVARVPVPEIPAGKIKPGRVTLLWDASGSAAARDIEKEIAFLVAYFKELGTAEVKLVVFSNDVWPLEKDTFTVKDGNGDDLLKTLAAIRPDGGTRLGCLDLKKLDAATDQFLLVSDGLSNFGEGEIVTGEKPVACVVSSGSADFELLDRIASKGALVNLLEVGTAEAVSRALSEPRTLLGIDFEAARVAEVYPPMPARLEGRVVSFAGRVSAGEKTKLTLRFGHGAVESARVEVIVDPASLTETGRAERIWATRKIEALSQDKVKNEDEIVRLAKGHSVVTPFTSLLVLDTIDQYVRYRVVPPKDMEDEYWKRVEAEKAQAAKGRDERIAQVKTKWAARVDWWNKEFKYPADLKVAPEKGESAAQGVGGAGAPAPAPPMEAPRGGGERQARRIDRNLEEAGKVADKKSSGGDDRPEGITLKPWDPSTPYIAAYKKVTDAKDLYACYLDQRKSNATSTAFFLDSADYFYGQKLPGLALRILSNLAELQLENAPLLRILGYRLKQAGELDLAIATFKVVQRIRPEEPQSFRDLGLAQADAKDWANAVSNLEKVVLGNWDGRFPDIDLIALGELNNVIAKGGKQGCTLPDDLIKALDYDMRIILTWDADMCDMDLWVTEPSGEKAFYGHRATQTGGAFGQDFTQGYGPEEYLVKKAMKGDFKIQVNYYGNRQQLLAGDTTIQVTVIKNYGRPNEERREVTRRLKEKQEVLDIADVAFGK